MCLIEKGHLEDCLQAGTTFPLALQTGDTWHEEDKQCCCLQWEIVKGRKEKYQLTDVILY